MIPVEPLMTPEEVAWAFGVRRTTVTHWADAGKLRTIRTLGGHRRYFRAEVEHLLTGEPEPVRAS